MIVIFTLRYGILTSMGSIFAIIMLELALVLLIEYMWNSSSGTFKDCGVGEVANFGLQVLGGQFLAV